MSHENEILGNAFPEESEEIFLYEILEDGTERLVEEKTEEPSSVMTMGSVTTMVIDPGSAAIVASLIGALIPFAWELWSNNNKKDHNITTTFAACIPRGLSTSAFTAGSDWFASPTKVHTDAVKGITGRRFIQYKFILYMNKDWVIKNDALRKAVHPGEWLPNISMAFELVSKSSVCRVNEVKVKSLSHDVVDSNLKSNLKQSRVEDMNVKPSFTLEASIKYKVFTKNHTSTVKFHVKGFDDVTTTVTRSW